ncbi:MAG: N-glycosylase/DNA lyase [Aigarchaeota archaeon]|nr:N-glycosylase/DNA lyase [Aigarchaeota archaeon]MDW8021052.1 N-glycosylase/DNA lyase [Nitrososphaerota archaeon]
MGFRELVEDLKALKSNEEIRRMVEDRLSSFKEVGRGSPGGLFKELAFCILAANFTASGSMKIIDALGDRLLKLDVGSLERELRRLGHRYPHARAEYIVSARNMLGEVVRVLRAGGGSRRIREWLVKNVKGLGYKEASHFLRNIGYDDVAIIDFHIIRLLHRYGLIPEVKRLGKKRYLEIEKLLSEVASQVGMTMAELDLYLWYMDSGKILK